MGRLNTAKKEEIKARIKSFNFSGFENQLSYSVCLHFRSFVGRDFKTIAECTLFILGPYMLPNEKIIWVSLSKVCIYHFVYIIIDVYTGLQDCILSALQLQQSGWGQEDLYRICFHYPTTCSWIVKESKDSFASASCRQHPWLWSNICIQYWDPLRMLCVYTVRSHVF